MTNHEKCEKCDFIRKIRVNLDAIKLTCCDYSSDQRIIDEAIELLQEYEDLLFNSEDDE